MVKLVWRRLTAYYYTQENVMITPPWEIAFKNLFEKFGENKTEASLIEAFPPISMQQCVENAKEYGRTPDFEYSFDENLIKWKNIATDKSSGASEVWIPEFYGTEDFFLAVPAIYKMGYLGDDWDESWNDSLALIWAYRYAHNLIYAPHRGADGKGFWA